jgi:HD-GYP domain-containing protein (c-di-GMP phosphodiesterase class II)
VPDAVLSKQSSLTATEWDAIRQHPVLGTTILEQAPELREVVPAVLHHQERWDGTGYPDRLAGEAIPLPARIISAADAYHAIRSDRPYRSGRTHDAALAELCRCSGAQFDPRVVTALTGALEAEPGLRDLFAPALDGGTDQPPMAVDRITHGFAGGPLHRMHRRSDAQTG